MGLLTVLAAVASFFGATAQGQLDAQQQAVQDLQISAARANTRQEAMREDVRDIKTIVRELARDRRSIDR